MPTQHARVVILGAGSLFSGRNAIWQMVHRPHLNGGTLALVDIDADRLAKMEQLARMVVKHNGVELTIQASTERTVVLDDADFVVLSFADRKAAFGRAGDERAPILRTARPDDHKAGSSASDTRGRVPGPSTVFYRFGIPIPR